MLDEQTVATYGFEWLPPQHKHCRGCGLVIPTDRVLCEVCDPDRAWAGGGGKD